jgi:hypothetical protein
LKTYLELKNTIKDWAFNNNESFINNVPIFIKMAQEDLARIIRTPALENEVKLKSNSCRSIDIPEDLIELISLRRSGHTIFSQCSFKSVREMKEITADTLGETFFARHRNTWETYPELDHNEEVTVCYYYVVDDMVADEDCNTWLFLYSTAMLYGSLLHASIFNQDQENISFYSQAFSAEIQEIQKQGDDSEFSSSLSFNCLMVNNYY